GALLHGTSHDDVLNLTRLHFRASDRLPDYMPGHCRTFGVVQRAAIGLSDWRAGGRNNRPRSCYPPVCIRLYGVRRATRAALVSAIEVRTPIQTHPRPATQNARLTVYPLQGEIGAAVRRRAPTSGLRRQTHARRGFT